MEDTNPAPNESEAGTMNAEPAETTGTLNSGTTGKAAKIQKDKPSKRNPTEKKRTGILNKVNRLKEDLQNKTY